MESESYEVSAVEFAALDALGEAFRQFARYERSMMAPPKPGATFTLIVSGTAALSIERAAALSAWWRMLADEPER